MTDPRAANCQAVAVNAAGQVTGVLLQVRPMPSARYELVRADLIDETAAAGNTVAKCVALDKNGIETGERIYLAWPWPGMQDGKSLPGNPNGEHMLNGLTYNPPDIGPGALYVGDATGAPISDIIGGLGLPWNLHICFRLTWRERGAVVVTPPPPPPDPNPNPNPVEPTSLEYDVARIAEAVERIANYLTR